MKELNDQQIRRREELVHLREQGVNPYPYSFDRTHSAVEILSAFTDEGKEDFANVAVAGRVMAIRRMGKASFAHIMDQSGKIQVYIRQGDITNYDDFKLYDIGDIVGIRGYVFRTKVGEISVHAAELIILTKSLSPLPIAKEAVDEAGNKVVYDAFADVELRYRQRYTDLVVNSEVRETFIKRSAVISAMRSYMNGRGWLEVETPIMQPLYGGASARPFTTYHNALDSEFFLRISVELYLKRLIVGGFEGVFEIGKNFRNEGMDRTHNPEFTMMELYVAYKDYVWMMDTVEDMLEHTVRSVFGTTTVVLGEGKNLKEISFAKPYKRMTMLGSIQEYTGRDLRGMNETELRSVAQELGISLDPSIGVGKIIDEIFSAKVQEHLIQPTYIMDYPVEMSPLVKKHRSEQGLTERFELFVNGTEIANAYSELNDPIDQR